jgi:hypothetical protein
MNSYEWLGGSCESGLTIEAAKIWTVFGQNKGKEETAKLSADLLAKRT